MYYMKYSALICFILVFSLFSCSSGNGGGSAGELIKKKNEIDRLISDSSLLVLAKVIGRKGLVQVENRRYPQDIETTYNVMKDKKGRIVYIAEMPYKLNSDWFIAYKSYFDSTGHLFSFQRLNNFLNNGCTRGAAMENLVKYYDASFNTIDSVYTLTDTYKKPLDKGACKFPYNFPYQIFRTLKEYKEIRGFPAL